MAHEARRTGSSALTRPDPAVEGTQLDSRWRLGGGRDGTLSSGPGCPIPRVRGGALPSVSTGWGELTHSRPALSWRRALVREARTRCRRAPRLPLRSMKGRAPWSDSLADTWRDGGEWKGTHASGGWRHTSGSTGMGAWQSQASSGSVGDDVAVRRCVGVLDTISDTRRVDDPLGGAEAGHRERRRCQRASARVSATRALAWP
jgi:hypothetical protein